MASERTGTYGIYYGSPYSESEVLTNAEMQRNAEYINTALSSNGWSQNAICAMLGNMQAESSINPGRWQSDDVGNTGLGYGLVQWTPATNYINWCAEQGYSDPSEMDNNIARILYEVENGLQWIATSNYDLSFSEFSKSTESVDYLARAFLLNYERPQDQSETVQAARSSNAGEWYTYLSGGLSPGAGGGSTAARKRKKYNFLLFNRRRRMQRWIVKQ